MGFQRRPPSAGERCGGLLGTTEAPDRLLVACYARLEVHELAQAAYLLAQNRKLPQPDFSNFSQTPDRFDRQQNTGGRDRAELARHPAGCGNPGQWRRRLLARLRG